MQRYKMILAFDGTNFAGWQIQPGARTVQGELQKALATLLCQRIHVTGSSRTDSGVHAKSHVSHFTLDDKIDVVQLRYKLSHILPKDICLYSLEEVSMDFHARYKAVKKTYHYHMHLSPFLPPFQRLYTYHIKMPLNIEKMKEAAKIFEGEHNFSSFAHKADQGCAKSAPVKTIYRSEIIETEGGLCFIITGSGFLHKMVRNIVGTLIDVGRGKIPLEELKNILDAQDRRKAGKTAPPHGLFLYLVEYLSNS
jgi:tRNA pseudouridine38-40 synthase